MSNNLYALIMAGGEGTRFYPLSTPEKPKQFLNFIGEKSFIRQTFERILPMVPADKIYISTNEKYIDLVKEHLPEVPLENIIAEPMKKNTAPALTYSTAVIKNKNQNAIVMCFPSDHHIEDGDGFRKVLLNAVNIASDGYLVTLGMKPTWPSPEYGYISPKICSEDWSEVRQFAEKPDTKIAEEYLNKGYLWNGGIFVWHVNTLFEELKKYALEVYEPILLFKDGYEFCRNYFNSVPSISIDYAVMEKSSKVAVIPTSVGWSDVGTWDSIKRLKSEGVNISSCVKSVMEGDDLTPWRCIVPKPWGHEELWAYTPKYVGKILFIKKGKRLSLQYHKTKDETIRLLSGELNLQLGEAGTRLMEHGEVHHITPGMHHRMEAVSDCLVLEVSTSELDDVVRLEDDYGRKK